MYFVEGGEGRLNGYAPGGEKEGEGVMAPLEIVARVFWGDEGGNGWELLDGGAGERTGVDGS